MSNFFNRIGLADMEKMHSAIIGWIFSNENNALLKKKNLQYLTLFLIQRIFL